MQQVSAVADFPIQRMLRSANAPNSVCPEAMIENTRVSSRSGKNAKLMKQSQYGYQHNRGNDPATGVRLQARSLGVRTQYAAATPPRKLIRMCFFNECSQPTT